ncbi:MAG: amidohydrolase family protein [Deltaproteobacteria bacterium]|nr:amidohydrolase family protein [Deltaproteobacteria bacterium]
MYVGAPPVKVMNTMIMKPNMPSPDDPEDSGVPAGLPAVTDAHVHIFPPGIFSAVWQWFDENAWHIRYQLSTSEVFEFLLSHGIDHIVALQYAHKPGMAADLNRYMVEHCRARPGQVTGLATVFPGEDNAEAILREAFAAGLAGLKLHAHVQCFDMNSAAMDPLYECCRQNDKPILMHVGREPNSTAYRCDPYRLCSADKLELVLKNFPGLKICVPHLGFDELSAYRRLIEKYDHLWLDTTMVVANYFPLAETIDLSRYRTDRLLYGSDFPNIPYAWDRELKRLKTAGLSAEDLERILNRNAAELFGLKPTVDKCRFSVHFAP